MSDRWGVLVQGEDGEWGWLKSGGSVVSLGTQFRADYVALGASRQFPSTHYMPARLPNDFTEPGGKGSNCECRPDLDVGSLAYALFCTDIDVAELIDRVSEGKSAEHRKNCETIAWQRNELGRRDVAEMRASRLAARLKGKQ